MKTNSRYIVVEAILVDNKLIPLWDEKVKFVKDNNYGGDHFIIDGGSSFKHYGSVECMFDTKNKTLSMGEELNYYTEGSFKQGEEVYYEVSNRVLSESKISNIFYEEYEVCIVKGKKMDDWYKHKFEREIDDNTIYAIKTWTPYYTLENGVVIKSEYKLSHKK